MRQRHNRFDDAAFHTQTRGCCTAPSVLCAGKGRRQRRCRLFQPAGCCLGGATVLPLFQGGSCFHVSTDEPMMASMAGRYAAALFEIAKDDKQLAQVESDVKTFQGMLDASEDLRRLVRSPVISAEDQATALTALLGKAGNIGPDRQFPQADRPQPAPVRGRRHAQEFPRAAGPRARRGERRCRLRPPAQRRADERAEGRAAKPRWARTCRSIRASIPTCSAASSSRSAAG